MLESCMIYKPMISRYKQLSETNRHFGQTAAVRTANQRLVVVVNLQTAKKNATR